MYVHNVIRQSLLQSLLIR